MRNNIFLQHLRGLSILFIILYHYLKNKTNGFLSVSVFLQISGYINTYSSYRRKRSILRFYYNRFVSIFPELYLAYILILFITRKDSYNNILNLYNEIISAIIMCSNIYFYKKEVNYFSQYENQSYVLHFWYISLQQQLYLLFPILLYLFMDYKNILLSLCCVSFTLFSLYIFFDPSFAYYIVGCRLYEFIIGIFLNSKFNIDKDSLMFSIKNETLIYYGFSTIT